MMAADPKQPGEFNFEIRVKGDVEDLYEKLILVLAFSEAKMKELADGYFPDGFLGGDNDNDFF